MVKIAFEEEVPTSIRRDIENVCNEILEYYKNTGYSPPSGVKIKVGKGKGGYYLGRNNGNDIIEIGKEGIGWGLYTIGTFVHEDAHGILRNFASQSIDKSPPLFFYTLDEMFADLNALYFGYPIAWKRDPFKEEYSKAFEGLSAALSLSNRKKEIEWVKKILEEAEKGGGEKLLKYSKELYEIPPLQIPYTIIGERNPSNMFTSNIEQIRKISELKMWIKSYSELLFGDKEEKERYVHDTIWEMNNGHNSSRVKKLRSILENEGRYRKVVRGLEKVDEKLREIWEQKREIERSVRKKYGMDKVIPVIGREDPPEYKRFEEELKNNQEYQTLKKRGERLLKAKQKLYRRKNFIEREVGEANIDNILKDEIIEKCLELERTLVSYCMLLDYLKNNGRLTNFILRSIESEDYGGNRDEFMDFPHEVGGALAKKLYAQGVTPKDVINSPEKYLELCKKEIERTIEDWLEKYGIYQGERK